MWWAWDNLNPKLTRSVQVQLYQPIKVGLLVFPSRPNLIRPKITSTPLHGLYPKIIELVCEFVGNHIVILVIAKNSNVVLCMMPYYFGGNATWWCLKLLAPSTRNQVAMASLNNYINLNSSCISSKKKLIYKFLLIILLR